MELTTLKFPVVMINDAQRMILDELFSENTQKYLDNTTFESPAEQWAFRSGMNYVGLLLATKCFEFSNVAVNKSEVEEYYKLKIED